MTLNGRLPRWFAALTTMVVACGAAVAQTKEVTLRTRTCWCRCAP